MPDRIFIRQACSEDRDFVAGMVSSLLASSSPVWHDTEVLAPGFREVLAQAINHQSRRSTVLIAEAADETPLGFISLKVREDAAGVERAHVADLAVTDSARRMGVGTALMKAAESWGRDLGMGLLSLDVWSTNENALAFYRRLGYSAESVCLIKRLESGPARQQLRPRFQPSCQALRASSAASACLPPTRPANLPSATSSVTAGRDEDDRSRVR